MREYDLTEFLPNRSRLELTLLLVTVPVSALVMVVIAFTAYVNPIAGADSPYWLAPALIGACPIGFLVPLYIVHGRVGAARIRIGNDVIEITRASGRKLTLEWTDPSLSLRVTHREYQHRPRRSWFGYADYSISAQGGTPVVTEIPREAYQQIIETAGRLGLRTFETQGQAKEWHWIETVVEGGDPGRSGPPW
jgi:hypothetical protein